MNNKRTLVNCLVLHDAGDYIDVYSDKGASMGALEVIVGNELYYLPKFATVKKKEYPELQTAANKNEPIFGEEKTKIENKINGN